MNLFNQYETQDLKKEVTYSIDNKRNYEFVNPVTIKTDGFEKDAVNIKFLQPTNSNSKVKKSISFTFHLDELEKLIDDFSILRDKLKNNMEKVTEYPASEIKNILYAIIENYFGYAVGGDDKIPRPRLSVYKEDDKVFFSAVDFKNNVILINHEIYLENVGIDLHVNEYNDSDNIFNNIVNAITAEITNSICDDKSDPNFSYIANKVGDLGTFNIETIVHEYVYENTRIEDDIFN